jgi:cation transport ATPase
MMIPMSGNTSHHESDWWAPRPSTILTAVLVGSSLFVYETMDLNISTQPHRYGWPVTYRVRPWNPSTPSPPLDVNALAADIAIAAALLASSCVTTQLAASRLVKSSRLTLRSMVLLITAIALFLAMWRLVEGLPLLLMLVAGLFYALASPILLILILLLRWIENLAQPRSR